MDGSRHLAILGAGPIGLEAALAAAEAGFSFTLYEASAQPAGNVAAWAHVRLFTPWSLSVSPRMRCALEGAGRPAPAGDASYPTGRELRERVLVPVAALPVIGPSLRLGERVLAVGREGLLKHEEIATERRRAAPFRLLVQGRDGRERIDRAGAVLDCSGTWDRPLPTGSGGIPAPGERELGGRIERFLPDFGRDAARWAGRSVLLVGAGHSAQTAARELARLAAQASRPPRVVWLVRRDPPDWRAVAGDPLPERAALAHSSRELAAGGSAHLECRTGRMVEGFAREGERIRVEIADRAGRREEIVVDRVLSLVGSSGDALLYRQLQIHECYATEGPMRLAAALLGGSGDCLTQAPQGPESLLNPEPDFFVLGSKSYGRNPTFLLRVGWQQVDEAVQLLRGAVALAG